jgi:Dynein heavy chain AAA lid domain
MNEDLLPRLASLAISPMEDASTPHHRFRLFISSAPSSALPLSLLDVATTIAIDAPQRLRAQLQATLASLDEGVWSSPDGMLPTMWSDILVALALFHSVALQRRKFGPLGWNVPYDFTPADLTSLLAIARHCMPAAPGAGANGSNGIAAVDWSALRRAASAVAYGGRVTDDEDAMLLAALVNHVMRPGNGAASSVGISGTGPDMSRRPYAARRRWRVRPWRIQCHSASGQALMSTCRCRCRPIHAPWRCTCAVADLSCTKPAPRGHVMSAASGA